ncbi:hypothetical protein ADL03_41560 [Nocardia sp. NRRL S-836]|nr:hypothetical protein ADL03_41560 [Nocardia sp. NRRL S-836]
MLEESYRPLDAVHHVRWGGTERGAVTCLDHHLWLRLLPEALDQRRSDELIELARELLVDEALAFLRRQLESVGITMTLAQHDGKLRRVLGQFVERRSLGQACRLMVNATSLGRNVPGDRVPSASAVECRVLSHLDQMAWRACLTSRPLESYPYLRGPLAAMTKTLFEDLFQLDAITSNLGELRAALPAATRATEDAVPADVTDLPVLRCGECRLPLTARDAWLEVPALSSMTAEDSTVSADHADTPALKTWRLSHEDCLARSGGYEVGLPSTYRDVVGLAAALLTKSWIPDTDLAELLYEASTLTGRFTPAHVDRLRASAFGRSGSASISLRTPAKAVSGLDPPVRPRCESEAITALPGQGRGGLASGLACHQVR